MIKVGDLCVVLKDYPCCAMLKNGDIVRVVTLDKHSFGVKKLYNDTIWKVLAEEIKLYVSSSDTNTDINIIINNENKGSDVDMMTVGTRVMAVVDSRVGVYEAGDIGTVTKFREDADGATVGVLFDHKDVVTFVKPQNFTTKFDDYTDDEFITIDATDCGCGHCTCDDGDNDGDQVYVINDGNGYSEGDCGVKIADVRGGILVDFADDDGKPVYVLDGDFMYGLPAPIVSPYGTIKFYNLSSLSTKGWRFDDAGVLRHPDCKQFMAGAMLNLIDGTFDAVTKEDEGEDNIVITVDGNEFIIAKSLKGILFKDVK